MNARKTFDGYVYGTLGYPEMLQNLLPLLKQGQTALDLGIGTGHMCSPIAFAGLNITGVDSDQEWLTDCQEAFSEAELATQLTTVHSDALEYMQTNKASFDLVVLSDFLMFLTKTDGKEILKLAYEALNAGGYIWITTLSTNDDYFQNISQFQEPVDAETFMAYSHCHGTNPICFYFPKEIENLLTSIGSEIIFRNETENRSGGLINIILAQKPA